MKLKKRRNRDRHGKVREQLYWTNDDGTQGTFYPTGIPKQRIDRLIKISKLPLNDDGRRAWLIRNTKGLKGVGSSPASLDASLRLILKRWRDESKLLREERKANKPSREKHRIPPMDEWNKLVDWLDWPDLIENWNLLKKNANYFPGGHLREDLKLIFADDLRPKIAVIEELKRSLEFDGIKAK